MQGSRKGSKHNSKNEIGDDSSNQIIELTKKLKDVENLYSKLKSNNENIKTEYQTKKQKFVKVIILK